MSALHLIRDGVSTAAELAVLLFLPLGAAAAAETRAAPATAQIVRADAAMPAEVAHQIPLHLVDSVFEMRLLGLLAELRVVQTLQNNTTSAVDLGAHLPAATPGVDGVLVARDSHEVDLLAGGDCGGDEDPHAGHARTEIDELIAEVLLLPPGQFATIVVTATETLQRSGAAWRVALPAAVAPIRAQALLVDQPGDRYLVVIPPVDAAGLASVTLRPAGAPSRHLMLGSAAPGTAFVIPVGDAEALTGPAGGAIEIEARSAGRVHWMTLPVLTSAAPMPLLTRAAN